LYCSCKNYQELAQDRITIVVGYFTPNPTKLVLHFKIFLRFSMQFTNFSQSTSTIGVNLLQGGPRKDSGFCNEVPGQPAGAGEQNSGEAHRNLAGERLGRSLWATRVLFVHWVNGQRWPVSGAPAAREGRPWWLLFRRGWGREQRLGRLGSLCRR
jgi:hypothetical protein